MSNTAHFIKFLAIATFSSQITAKNVVLSGTDCAELCSCKTDTITNELTVDCRNAGVNQVPSDIPENVAILDLSFNNFRSVIDSEFSKFSELRKVFLNDNTGLETLMYNSFSNNAKLEIINLDNTKIKTFSGLNCTNLRELHLKTDRLVTFDFDGFVTSLQHNKVVNFFLEIGGHDLEEITTENLNSLMFPFFLTIDGSSDSAIIDVTKVLSKIPKTQDLIIKNTGKADLEFSFPFYDNLESLYLISTDASNFLELRNDFLPVNLKTLTIRDGGLREISTEFLENFHKLSVLDLANNLIENLECANLPIHRLVVERNPMKTACLENMRDLEFFMAAGCEFEEVPFSREVTPMIVGSEMMRNQLKHLDGRGMPESFEYFDVSGNPFICDCEDAGHQSYVNRNMEMMADGLRNAYDHECTNVGESVLDVDLSDCESYETTEDMPTSESEVTDGGVTDGEVTSSEVETDEATTETTSATTSVFKFGAVILYTIFAFV